MPAEAHDELGSTVDGQRGTDMHVALAPRLEDAISIAPGLSSGGHPKHSEREQLCSIVHSTPIPDTYMILQRLLEET